VLEEADETLFWLELLVDAGVARREQIAVPLDEAEPASLDLCRFAADRKGFEI
jgi:hypothetical protein